MLGSHSAVATVGVKRLDAAKAFYTDKLGLEAIDTGQPNVLAFKSANGSLMVYESEFGGTNQATSVTWPVGKNVEKVVADLKAKGVQFEHYDMPMLTRKGDLYEGDGMQVAWFKDPDGNIHSVVSGETI